MLEDQTFPALQVRVPLGMLNRHGLVAGATGTGKTKTLQVMAEQLSDAGVPVFISDIKGDISGLSAPAVLNDKLTVRAQSIGFTDYAPKALEWTNRAQIRAPAPNGRYIGYGPATAAISSHAATESSAGRPRTTTVSATDR
jgi:DNA helicase HerA-like ATPase